MPKKLLMLHYEVLSFNNGPICPGNSLSHWAKAGRSCHSDIVDSSNFGLRLRCSVSSETAQAPGQHQAAHATQYLHKQCTLTKPRREQKQVLVAGNQQKKCCACLSVCASGVRGSTVIGANRSSMQPHKVELGPGTGSTACTFNVSHLQAAKHCSRCLKINRLTRHSE